MNGLWRFHTSRKKGIVRTIPIKKPFVHECNALEFGTVSSSQKEVNNDNFPFLAATEPMKSCLFPASLQLPPEELGE